MTKKQAQAISQQIADQIGGKAFFMLGAQNLAAGMDDDKRPILTFRIRGSKRVNYIRVTYNQVPDLYTMTFMRVTNSGKDTVAEHHDVYCDQLHELIEQETGLYTSF